MKKPKEKQTAFNFQGKVKKPELREYQLRGVEEMRDKISQGILRIILVLPTGGGKTVVAAHVIDAARIHNSQVRILFCAHRIELINQTANQLARFGITDIGVIRADDERTDERALVQVASIDTLRRRDKPPADIIFIDECHRSMSDTYRDIFNYYRDSLFIGLTATPFRSDNQGLGELYQSLVVCAKPSQLISDGFISSPRVFLGAQLPDMSNVSVVQGIGDYHNAQLFQQVSKPMLVGNVVEEWKTHAKGRRTVVFAVNIEHSKLLCDEFKKEGIRATHVDANTTIQERNRILLELEAYKYQVVCNVDVLTEGWDQPSVRCACLVRPTLSLRLHLQQCGRVLRPYDGDVLTEGVPTDPLILDHAGNCIRHGLPQWDREFTLERGQHRKETKLTIKTCEKCFALWGGNSRICPECGYELPAKETKPLEYDITVQLKEIDPTKIFSIEDQKRHFFLKEITKCREEGMKPGSASYRFKEKFGHWPPFVWSNQAKQMFTADVDWQHEVEKRTKRREYWQNRNRQIEEQIEENVQSFGKDEGFTQEPEEGFFDDGDIPF